MTTDEALMKPRKTETRMLGWHSRLRLVFAGRRVEDQIQQVCFNQFILSKTPNQQDRIAIRWISCKNFTKLRHEGTLWRAYPFYGTDNGDFMTELQKTDGKILLFCVRVETAV